MRTFCLSVVLALGGTAQSDVIYVDDDAPGGGSGRSWSQAFDRLELALAAARPGDEVWVAGGIYSPFTNPADRDATFAIPDGVRVYGGFVGDESTLAERGDPLEPRTQLDGAGVSYNVVTMDDIGPGTTLDGFTITGGLADGPTGRQSRGAGIHARGATGATPTLRNLVITDCSADFIGTAIYASSLSTTPMTFEDIEVVNCAGSRSAVFISGGSSNLTRVNIRNNSVMGLVIFSDGFHRILDCRIDGNTSPSTDPTFLPNDVGGVFIEIEPTGIGSEIVDTVIRNNSGPRTGGLRYRGAGQHAVRNSRIVGNTGSSDMADAGGIAVASTIATIEINVDNCLIADNHVNSTGGSSAMLIAGNSATLNIRNSTIAGNSAVGLNNSAVRYASGGATGTVANTIIWGNTNAGPANDVTDSLNGFTPGPTADRCIIEFYPANPINVPYPSTDCSGEDPLFVSAVLYDLSEGSPAIDAGDNNNAPALVATDIFNRPRFLDDTGTPDTGEGLPGEPIIDIGAAEFQGTTPTDCVADTNGDGMLSPADFNGWIIAYNNQSPACDQNGDGLCTPADFNGWIINFNNGC